VHKHILPAVTRQDEAVAPLGVPFAQPALIPHRSHRSLLFHERHGTMLFEYFEVF
jgi:hypothetical protein